MEFLGKFFQKENEVDFVRQLSIFVINHGGSHLGAVKEVVNTLVARGHNVTLVIGSSSVKSAKRMLPIQSNGNEVHILTWNMPEQVIPDSMADQLWKSVNYLDEFYYMPKALLTYISYYLLSESPRASEILKQNAHACDLVIFDPFLVTVPDTATAMHLPAVAIASFASIWNPPAHALFPLLTPSAQYSHYSTETENEVFLSYLFNDLLAPFTLTFASLYQGMRVYGYPRHLFASCFAYPWLTPTLTSMISSSALPRSVIPFATLPALSPPTMMNFPFSGFGQQPMMAAAMPRGSVGSSVPRVKLPSLPEPCQTNRPLLLPINPQQPALLYAAFGTHGILTEERLQTLCQAFAQVLDHPNNTAIEAVIFARQPVQRLVRKDDKNTTAYCTVSADSPLPACQDPRIWSASWVNQQEILAGGQVNLFLTHGGFSSMQEGLMNQVPMVVMSLFGDQPSNGQVLAANGLGKTVSRQVNASHLAHVMMVMIQHREEYVQHIYEQRALDHLLTGGRDVERVTTMLETMAREGVNNSYQRLVPRQWAHYGKADKNMTSLEKMDRMVATIGASMYLVSAAGVAVIMVWMIWMIGKMMKWLMMLIGKGIKRIVTMIGKQGLMMKQKITMASVKKGNEVKDEVTIAVDALHIQD